MCRKMTNHGIAVIGVALLVFLSVACASAPESLEYREISPHELNAYKGSGKKFVTETRLLPDYGNINLVDAGGSLAFVDKLNESFLEERIDVGKVYRVYLTCRSIAFSIDRIDGLKSVEEAQLIIDQRNAERIAAEEAQRQAQEEAQRQTWAEARRKARGLSLGTDVSVNLGTGEEHWYRVQATRAGRVFIYTMGNTDTYLEAYDANNRLIAEDNNGGEGNNASLVIPVEAGGIYLFKLKGYGGSYITTFDTMRSGPYRIIALDEAAFIFALGNFRPAIYTPIDLFTAVANVERMRGSIELSLPRGWVSSEYVSEVVFVNQNGTDILFRTVDNAISQRMKIDGRSGLTSGQRVRLYYSVTKDLFAEWRVVAIERL